MGAVGAVGASGGALAGCGTAAIPGASAEAQGSGGSAGRLRIGVTGGSVKDSLDAHSPVTHPDEARVVNLYDSLGAFDPNYRIEMALAESIESSKDALTWTVRLRDGVEFHNGKTLAAEDVVFSLNRIIDPKNPQANAVSFASIAPGGVSAIDKRTVRIKLHTPDMSLLENLSNYANGVVPVGYDPKKPVGTGPYKLVSFEPGQQSVFTRHPNYWRPDQPKTEELVIIDFPDDTARVNALLGGQVDAIDQLPVSLIRVVQADPSLRVLEAQTGAFLPFTMRVDQPPFDDVRVRQAFRLIVDRKQMVEQVLSGHGVVANDLYGRYDPAYNHALPQREQNIAQARALLKEAGHGNGLTVELVTSDVAAGLVEAASVFVEQAKLAGVTVKLRKVDPGVFYGDQYLSWTFAQDFWYTHDFLAQAAGGSLPDSPYNETHFKDPEFIKAAEAALAETDTAKRDKLIQAAQKIEYDRGGYIVWGFVNQVDAYNSRLTGFEPVRSGIPLSGYEFRKIGFRA
jgi:peptide/nickel transport system substrate-binding protein